jgi:hypothetical protein
LDKIADKIFPGLMSNGCNTEQQLHNNKCVPQLVSSFLFVKITEKEQGPGFGELVTTHLQTLAQISQKHVKLTNLKADF